MIYSRHHDTVVLHTGTEAWLASLDPTAVSPWSPWFYTNASMGSPQVDLTHQASILAPSTWQTCIPLIQPHLLASLAENQALCAEYMSYE